MKITFIYPDFLLHRPDWEGYFYGGIGSLSAVLKEGGHETSLIHDTKPMDKSDFIARVEKEDADLIGFSSTSPMFPSIRKYVSWLAEAGIKVPTICGGMHATIAPEECIEVEGIDMICRGEGEVAMKELCGKLEKGEDTSTIANLWFKKDGIIARNALRPLLEDLDTLPFPDRGLFDYTSLFCERDGRGAFLVARGCPYNCTYCSNHLLRKIYASEGKATRFRSVDNIIAEIKQVLQDYPFIKIVNFDDDILFLKKDWSEEFAEKYRRQINLPFICNSRANLTTKAMVDLLKRAGCYHVKFGLESGNEYISDKILNRHLTNDQIKNAFALCNDVGLITESFNMVGIPYDTPSTILDTIKLNAAVSVDKMQVSIFQPYEGTKLTELCREQGFLIEQPLDSDWFSRSILKLDTITPSHILMFRDYFKILVRYYQTLQKLPGPIARGCIKFSDKLLSFVCIAKVLNLMYIPLNFLYRKSQIMRVKRRSSPEQIGQAAGISKRPKGSVEESAL